MLLIEVTKKLQTQISDQLYSPFVPSNPISLEDQLLILRQYMINSNYYTNRLKQARKYLMTLIATETPSEQNASQSPIGEIPLTLPVPGKRPTSNPATYDKKSQYHGTPGKYPDLTATQKQLLILLNHILKQNKLDPITELWGGRYGGHTINFIAYGANKQFVWKKYGTGGMNSYNKVYFGTNEMNTSSFVRITPAQQASFLSTTPSTTP